jgi:hypothetical protein
MGSRLEKFCARTVKFILKLESLIKSEDGMRAGFKIIIGLIIFASFFYVAFAGIDPDLGWHLKIGEWIYANKQVPHFDQFTHTMPGHRWVAHEWLIEVFFWLAMKNNLWWMMCVFFALLVFLPFFLWLKRAKSKLAILYILLAAMVMTGIVGVRPQILSFTFFFLCFEILFRRFWRSAKFDNGKLFYLGMPLLFFVWANLHAGFIAGLALFMLLFFIDLIWSRQTDGLLRGDKRKKIFNLAVLLVSVAVTFINPYGFEIYQEIFRTVFSSEIAKYIVECLPFFYFNSIDTSFLIGISLFFILREIRRYQLNFLAATVFFMASFLKSFRMIPMFFVTIMPLIFSGIERAGKEIREARKDSPFSLKSQCAIKIVGAIIFLSVFVMFGFRLVYFKPFEYPEDAAVFLKKYNEEKKINYIFNDFGWGGYLIWQVPEIKLFIDGRMPAWRADIGKSAMIDYTKASYFENEDEWQEVFARRKVDLVFIKNEVNNSQGAVFLKKYLPENIKEYLVKRNYDKLLLNLFGIKKQLNLRESLVKSGWQIIYEDDLAVILKKP